MEETMRLRLLRGEDREDELHLSVLSDLLTDSIDYGGDTRLEQLQKRLEEVQMIGRGTVKRLFFDEDCERFCLQYWSSISCVVDDIQYTYGGRMPRKDAGIPLSVWLAWLVYEEIVYKIYGNINIGGYP
jgi:hypothetical protein